MNLNEYQNLSKRTLPEFNRYEGLEGALANYGLGLSGESGEVVDHIKKCVFHGHSLNVEEIENELGDVMHYVAGLATMCGLTLEGIATRNIDKLEERYPSGFNSEDSVNRKE